MTRERYEAVMPLLSQTMDSSSDPDTIKAWNYGSHHICPSLRKCPRKIDRILASQANGLIKGRGSNREAL